MPSLILKKSQRVFLTRNFVFHSKLKKSKPTQVPSAKRVGYKLFYFVSSFPLLFRILLYIIISLTTDSVVEGGDLRTEEKDKLFRSDLLAVAFRSAAIVMSVHSFSKTRECTTRFTFRRLYPASVA